MTAPASGLRSFLKPYSKSHICFRLMSQFRDNCTSSHKYKVGQLGMQAMIAAIAAIAALQSSKPSHVVVDKSQASTIGHSLATV